MTESIVADFVARHRFGHGGLTEATTGRVVMSPKRLVLVGDSGRTTIPLKHIVDLGVGHVSDEVSEFFDDSVSITYDTGSQPRTVTVEGDQETMEQFEAVMFKTLLNGTKTLLFHPVAVGGYGYSPAKRAATVRIKDGRATFVGEDGETVTHIDKDRVIGIRRDRRPVAGNERSILVVRHLRGDRPMTTEVAADIGRKLSILMRFLRIEYDARLRTIDDLSLETEALSVLAATYTDPTIDVTAVLGNDVDAETIIDELRFHDLLDRKPGPNEDAPPGLRPTLLGQTLLSARHEDIFD